MNSNRKKIGLLGGSFDPPHLGHLTLAQDAYECLRLDSVWFVPTYLSPHKQSFHLSPASRADMVELMTAEDERFKCCRWEVESGTSQFSVDTVSFLQQKHQNCDFYWLLGADQLPSLHLWKDIDRLCSICQICVFKRPGYSVKLPIELNHLSVQYVDMHEMHISSSELRERIRDKLPVYMFLHPAVKQHIEDNQLYN